ncbi:hypothetical protein BsWGS_06589 [Bradybaena similaris]
MSRGVRDLRELICVSRLSYHEEENETVSGDDDKLLHRFTTLSVCSEHVVSEPECSQCFSQKARVISPDSGCIINESPGTCYSDNLNASDDIFTDRDILPHTNLSDESIGKGSSTSKSKLTKSAKKRRKKKGDSLLGSRHELPKSPTLQPLHVGANEMNLNENRYLNKSGQVNELNKSNKRTNFDDILPYMDVTLVSNWLTRSNASIQELYEYFSKGNNFVQFAHFWLSEFPDIQKREIFSMEYDILLDEISLAFTVGKENRKVLQKDILELCEAVFKEFPAKLLAENGSCVFLDYLDILSSEKQDSYKRLLSNVRCSTSNRQYAQWLLATRCFALVNVSSAVVNFYRNLVEKTQGLPALDLCSTKETVPHRRLLQAIRLGYIDVINYYTTKGHVSPLYCDSHQRSLLFTAVMHNQMEVVRHFLTSEATIGDINKPSDTGNTALHAASNSGNLAIVDLLCHSRGLDVNCVNPQCENATPLHLAVMHGHTKVVEYLLEHGADSQLKMGDTTVRDLARDFDHSDILKLFDN